MRILTMGVCQSAQGFLRQNMCVNAFQIVMRRHRRHQQRGAYLVLGLICFLGGGSLSGAEIQRGSRKELDELRAADVPRLIEVLSEDAKTFLVTTRPRAVNPFSNVSSWKIATTRLRDKVAHARPRLIPLIDSPNRLLCARALDVLSADDIVHRKKLKPQVLRLVNDDSGTVRRTAVQFLGAIKDGEIEDVLAKRVKALVIAKEKDYELIGLMVSVLTKDPINEDRVVGMLLHLLDHVKYKGLLRFCMEQSKQFRSSEKYGLKLTKSYWQILNEVQDVEFLDQASSTMDGRNPWAFDFLLKAPGIKRDETRSVIAATLVGHSKFNPVKRGTLFSTLIKDRSPKVHRRVVQSLANRHDVSAAFRSKVIYEALKANKVAKDRINFYGGIFTVLQYLPLEQKMILLRDGEFRLGEKIAGDLKKEEFRKLIIFQSYKVMGKAYRAGEPSREELAERVAAWWQQFVAKGVE